MVAILARGPYRAKTDRVIERESWSRVRVLGARIHLAVVAEQPVLADQCAGEIVTLADRRLRQIGGNDAA